MNRVAIVGVGLVSSLGNDWETVSSSLKQGKSGIGINQSFIDKGLRSHISGVIKSNRTEEINKKISRFMGEASKWAYSAMEDAIAQAEMSQQQLSSEDTALIVGAGGFASEDLIDAVNVLEEKGIRRIGPYRVTRQMGSSVSANLATAFKIQGPSYSISSACSTSAHCIGTGYQQIKMGLQTTVITGGVDQPHWSFAMQFDGMGALSTKYNNQPEKASRPYDIDRDGFVISGGAGIAILENWDHAVARGANILAEVVGYAASSDGDNMVAPNGIGAERAMLLALKDANLKNVDYINTHGTSTPVGDLVELKAITRIFSENMPLISSTKSLSGHALGAAGVHEMIFSLIMMQENFVCASANLNQADDLAKDLPIVTEVKRQVIKTALSNSFGFGGTNACLVLKSI
ncbi:MAG: 3-oxoacyl-[acyl-carrier-protein] synthase-1 [Crocinitomicaceae bacterium]|jgi:3-oxoacyl-[acyl-carrier-protein] synthase-1